MNAARPDCNFCYPTQFELDVLRREGVEPLVIAKSPPLRIATGYVASDNLFEPSVYGERWFAVEVEHCGDIVFWDIAAKQLCSWTGRSFALGEEAIGDAATYSFGYSLNIFADPFDWLRARRDGIVVLPTKWPLAFDRLRDCPRVTIAEQLLPYYRRWMKPAHLPEVSVLRAGARLVG